MISKRLHPASFSNVNAQLAQTANTIPHQMIQFNVLRGLVNYVTTTKTLEIPASFVTLAGGTYKAIASMSLVLPSSNIFDIYYNGTTIVAQMGNSVPTGGTYYYLFSISNASIPMISGLENYSINGVAVNSMVYGVINTGRINYDTVSKTIVASISKLYVNGKAITVNIQDTKTVTLGLTDTFYICLRYYDFALLATQNPTDIVVATISNGKVIYGENISINGAFKGNLTPLKDLNIWCFGDSLTKGVIEGTTTIVESYPYNLNVLTDGAHITNFGVPGATAIDMLATIKTHTDFMANCDIAIIGIGTNGYLGGDFETSKENEATQIGAYCSAIKYILENSNGKTKIVMLNPIKRMTTEGIPDRWLAATHWNCMRIANHFGVDCIDLYKMLPILPTDTLYYSADGVHLNARGYYRMARVIYDYLMANVSNCRATGIASPAFDY